MKSIVALTEKFKVIKNNKKLSLIVIAGFIAVFLIFVSELDFGEKEVKNEESGSEISTTAYCNYLEEKVTEIIESINGAGKTRVMITLSETTEYVYATNNNDTHKSTEKNNDSANKKDYVIMEYENNDRGLLIKTIEPKVRGIAIVCEGGDSTTVQQEIYSAVSAVLNISTSRISISKLTHLEESNEK